MMTHRALGSWVLAGWLCAAPCLASDTLAPLLACRALNDSKARLACFDRESAYLAAPPAAPATAAASSRPAGSLPPSTSPSAPSALPPVADPKQTFGLPEATIAEKEVAAGTRPKELAKIDARITSVSLTGVGVATFTLDNGQVWRQLTPEGDLLAKPGDPATLSRGMFHSYWLQLKSGRGCKVTRIL